MLFDDLPLPGILNMMRLRGWELVTPAVKPSREDGLVLSTNRKCLLPGLGQWETVTVFPGVTPLFRKHREFLGDRYCWVDRRCRLLISNYIPTPGSRTPNDGFQLFELCEGLDYIDEYFGSREDILRVKAYRELARPKPV